MTDETARDRMKAQIPHLAEAVSALDIIGDTSPEQLSLLPTTGLAHDHIRIESSGLVLRVPRQSQLALTAKSNLDYQRACFERAALSGNTPCFHAAIDPEPNIPMGALLVEFIEGSPISLPDDLPNAARTLASIHALPLPAQKDRAPLKTPDNPVLDTLNEVLVQSRALYANGSTVNEDSIKQIEDEIAWATSFAETAEAPPTTLISFDAHPGNFIQETSDRNSSRAVLVDLEKARYGVPGFDLAHASLYTSTTWDVATYAELSASDVCSFYDSWLQAAPGPLSESMRQWLLPCRRIMWLWSVTWCAKWAVESGANYVDSKDRAASTEDWSSDNTERELIEHVAGRVRCYLDPSIIELVRKDWAATSDLTSLLD